jgi:hypothetical protein
VSGDKCNLIAQHCERGETEHGNLTNPKSPA